MRKRDQLQQLIVGLTANEKRYFKLFSGLQGGDKSYLTLFDALAETDNYDAGVISKKTGKSKAALAHNKEHLKEVLLRALRTFNQDSMHDAFYHHTLEDVELLRSKGLNDWALAKVEKAIEKAVDEEALQYAQILLRFYHALAFHTGKGAHQTKEMELERKLVRQVANEMEYRHLHMQFLDLINEQRKGLLPAPDSTMKAFIKNPLLTDVNNALSRKATLTFYRLNAMYHTEVSLDKKIGEKYFREGIKFFVDNGQHLASQFGVYTALSTGLAYTCMQHNEYDKADQAITDFENSLPAMKNVGLANLRYCEEAIIAMRMYIYTDSRNFAKAIAFGLKVQAHQKNVLRNSTPTAQFDFYHLMALSYWKTGEINAALKVMQHMTETVPDEFYTRNIANRCMYLLIQFDLENYTTLLSLLRGHQRWCRQHNLDGELMADFNKMVFELCKAENDVAGTRAILQTHLKTFNKAPANAERLIFDLFGLTDWMKGKMGIK